MHQHLFDEGRAISTLPFVFLDLETTGLQVAHGHRMCEIALVRTQGTTIEAQFESLVNPERAVDAQAFSVNHLGATMLAQAPLFASLADDVAHFMAGAIVVAHNAPFDIGFLRNEYDRLATPFPPPLVVDTLPLSRRLMRCASYSLASLAKVLQLPTPNHRAMGDVLTTLALFRHLVALMEERQIITLRDMVRLQRGLTPSQADPDPPAIIRQAINERRRLKIVYSSISTPEPTERLIDPIEVTLENTGLYLRAYCYLRNDVRAFAIAKIAAIELL